MATALQAVGSYCRDLCLSVSCHFVLMTNLICLIYFVGSWGGSLGAEEDFQWKMTFDGRQPSMESDLRRKTTLDER